MRTFNTEITQQDHNNESGANTRETVLQS